jgi:hypothetical protein
VIYKNVIDIKRLSASIWARGGWRGVNCRKISNNPSIVKIFNTGRVALKIEPPATTERHLPCWRRDAAYGLAGEPGYGVRLPSEGD